LKEFALLFSLLDQTNKTNEKIKILKKYFLAAPEKDKVWALALFMGNKPKKQVNSTLLRNWVIEMTGIPAWLFVESYGVVGDFAETASLLLEETEPEESRSLSDWFEFLKSLSKNTEEEKRQKVLKALSELGSWEKLVFIKLITGGFRIGVSHNLIVRAISENYGIEASVVFHRLMGHWNPETATFSELFLGENHLDDLSRPYPFCLAYALDTKGPETIGNPADWQAEWKWDGIRAQLIWRNGELYIWSRGEDLITEKFPELQQAKEILKDDIVLDGEILAFKNERPMPFGILQTRIGRKNVSKTHLKEAPAAFMIYDLLEYKREDYRNYPLSERRKIIEKLIAENPDQQTFRLSPTVKFDTWESLEKQWHTSREFCAEGLMLKKMDSPYLAGRKKGFWWKWKIAPLSIDGVLVYAQKGKGRRADLYSDYTFAVWDGEKLIPFAKAYSGLTDQEMGQVDYFIKRNVLEKFGPVRTVKPELVFEIGFEGIQESKRHKSGVALRFPRILRWRTDKKVKDADSLETLKEILRNY